MDTCLTRRKVLESASFGQCWYSKNGIIPLAQADVTHHLEPSIQWLADLGKLGSILRSEWPDSRSTSANISDCVVPSALANRSAATMDGVLSALSTAPT